MAGERVPQLSRRDFLKITAAAAAAPFFHFPLPDASSAEFLLKERAKPVLHIDTTEPYVTIGIDDGLSKSAVEAFLAIADTYQTKFTLFPTGEALLKYPDLWVAAKQQGHEIGNHSHSHIQVLKKSYDEIFADFSRFETEDYPGVFGEPFPELGVARVPYANTNHRTTQEVLFDLGCFNVFWKWDSLSWSMNGIDNKRNRETALKNLRWAKQGDVMVMHFNQLDMAILPAFLEKLAARGLSNVPFSTLKAAEKG